MNKHVQKWISSQNRKSCFYTIMESWGYNPHANTTDWILKPLIFFSFHLKCQDRMILHPGKMCTVRGHQLSNEHAGNKFYGLIWSSFHKSLESTEHSSIGCASHLHHRHTVLQSHSNSISWWNLYSAWTNSIKQEKPYSWQIHIRHQTYLLLWYGWFVGSGPFCA